MIKIVNIPNGDYALSVQSGGTITLDTGTNAGTVVVTGNLLVQGETTSIQTTNLDIEDNIILLNRGETGDGITLETSGMRIDRGTLADAFLVFDETISWSDPVTDTISEGLFSFVNENSDLIAIQTTNINTAGESLYFEIGTDSAIKIVGPNASTYATNVVDDEHIPNKKYVDDAVLSAASSPNDLIVDGTITPTKVVAIDEENSGLPSVVNIEIDGTNVASFYNNRVDYSDIRIQKNIIETTGSNTELVLGSPGTGDVVIDDTLRIKSVPGVDDFTLEPDFPEDGVRIYTSSSGNGGTGIYYANDESTRDELISNNRSLLYSMIF